MCFQFVTHLVRQSRLWLYLCFGSYLRNIAFHRKFFEIRKYCFLNVLKFDVFSVGHSLGQTVMVMDLFMFWLISGAAPWGQWRGGWTGSLLPAPHWLSRSASSSPGCATQTIKWRKYWDISIQYTCHIFFLLKYNLNTPLNLMFLRLVA